MKKSIILTSIILMFAALMMSNSVSALNVRFNIMFTPKHPLSREGFAPWAQEVGKMTDGRVKVTMFYSNALYKPTQAYDSIASRAADMGIIVASYQRNRRLLNTVMDLPMVAGEKAVINSQVVQELYSSTPEMQNELKDVKVLWVYMNPAFQLHFTKKKVQSLADLKNVVVSAGGQNQTRILESLGASVEAMPMTDVFLAMQKGVVEGCFLPYAPLKTQKIADLLHYHTNANLMAVTFIIAMNKDVWNRISPQDQKIIEGMSGMKASIKMGDIFDRGQIRDTKWMAGKGDEFYNLTPSQQQEWAAMIKPIRNEWIQDAKDKGYSNPEKLLDRALQLMAEKSK